MDNNEKFELAVSRPECSDEFVVCMYLSVLAQARTMMEIEQLHEVLTKTRPRLMALINTALSNFQLLVAGAEEEDEESRKSEPVPRKKYPWH